MHTPALRPTLAVFALVQAVTVPARSQEDSIRRVGVDSASRTAAAVVVAESSPLVYTGQIFPCDPRGAIASRGQADGQAKALLDLLEQALKGAGSGFDRIVKIDVYAATPEAVGSFQHALARRMPAATAPAVSYVVGALADLGALLALDAVAVAVASLPARDSAPARRAIVPLAGQRGGGPMAILDPGPRVFVSGQADPGTDPAEATRRTLMSLERTLNHLSLERSQVVRLKAFLNPMSAVADVEREIGDYFGNAARPPVTIVEWRSKVPIEIELVCAGGTPRAEAGSIEYLTPPQLKPSPVFSRVARVQRGNLVFISSLYGTQGASGIAQVESIYESLREQLSRAGSDFRHLVKATYYHTDDDASRALNVLRPKYYDPACPPAASKALVAGVGFPGRTVTLDMIAVETKP